MKKLKMLISAAFLMAALAAVQPPALADAEIDALKARLESLEKEVAEVKAALENKSINHVDKSVEISGVGYLSYAYDMDGIDQAANEFAVDRWYFTVRKKTGEKTSVRYTTDVKTTPDGNFDAYLKYGYVEMTGAVLGANMVFGLQDAPWVGHEDSEWRYRMQQKSASDLAGLLNSVEFGVALKNKFSNGDYHLLIANGEGGNRRERDTGKDIQGRISFALGGKAPKLSLYGDVGSIDGNKSNRIGAMVSGRAGRFSYGLSFMGGSDYDGYADRTVRERVYSVFTNHNFTDSPWSVFARYDHNDPDKSVSGDLISRVIAGVAVDLDKNLNLSIAAHVDGDDAAADKTDKAVKAVLQVKY
jgi:hypothetical protein